MPSPGLKINNIKRLADILNEHDRSSARALFAIGDEMLRWIEEGLKFQSQEKLGAAVYTSMEKRNLLVRIDKYDGRYFRDALMSSRRVTGKDRRLLITMCASASAVRSVARLTDPDKRAKKLEAVATGKATVGSLTKPSGRKRDGSKSSARLAVEVPIYDPDGFAQAMLSIVSQKGVAPIVDAVNASVVHINKSRPSADKLPMVDVI